MSADEDELAAGPPGAGCRPVPAPVIRAARGPGLPPRSAACWSASGRWRAQGPAGQRVRSRSTLDRWIRLAGGWRVRRPGPGARQVAPRTGAGVLELVVALKKEKPERTAAQVTRVLAAGWRRQVPSVRTIQRHFVRMAWPAWHGHGQRPVRRFEAATWRAVGLRRAAWPARLAAAKTYLVGIEDDHSRFITGHWWTTREDTTGLFAALRRAVEAHGALQAFDVENGSPYASR